MESFRFSFLDDPKYPCFLTSNIDNYKIDISKSTYLKDAMIHSFIAGYIKCYKDINAKYEESLYKVTHKGGYIMGDNVILDRINALDDKYDKKIDALSNKLDGVINNLNNNFSNINREIGEVKANVNSIKEDLDKIEDRIKFWKIYIVAPIITSIITAILMNFIIK